MRKRTRLSIVEGLGCRFCISVVCWNFLKLNAVRFANAHKDLDFQNLTWDPNNC